MNKGKYREIDYSTNFITTAKIGSYIPYVGMRITTAKSSHKKMEPLNFRVYERTKKKSNIICHKEDYTNLYLEGGQVETFRKIEEQKLISNDQPFYKVSKAKKKSEVIYSIEAKRRNGWTHSESREPTKKEDNSRMNQTNEPSLKTVSQELYQKSFQNFVNTSKAGVSKKKESMKFGKPKNFNSLKKVMLKSEENALKNRRRPLFYLQTKEIAHIKAESFILTEYPSGQVIMGNYYKKVGEIASLTKIMTFYTVLRIASFYAKDIREELIEIDEQAQSTTGTSAEILSGDIYTIQQLLYGLMLPSGNDAAIALAKWGGNILVADDPEKNQPDSKANVKRFVQEMNTKAKELELKSTKFGNPHGLPHSQSGSTPEEMAMLIQECLKFDIFNEVIKTPKYKCWICDVEGGKREVTWENTNKLLRRPHFTGIKTGVTITAGPCLATCYEANDKIFIIVLLRTTKLSRRFKETRWILALGLSKLDKNLYQKRVREILRNDPELDSDNSEDEKQFDYTRSDPKEMAKRNKILAFEM